MALGYLAVFGTVAGLAGYIVFNAGHIEEQLREMRPQILVKRMQVTVVESNGDGTTGATLDDGAAAADSTDNSAADAGSKAEAPSEGSSGSDTADSGKAFHTLNPDGTVPGDEIKSPIPDDGPDIPDAYANLLTPHPDPLLIENSPVGPLPVIGKDGRKPWRVYSSPYNALETRPRIAIIITNLGLEDDVTERALKVDGAIGLSFSPYARRLSDWIDKARNRGHEVLLDLPMEPADYPKSDAGPYAMQSSLDAESNLRRLDWIMSRATGYVGFVNLMGGAFTGNADALKPVIIELSKRGLLYVDNHENPVSIAPRIADASGVPNLTADVTIDSRMRRETIIENLFKLETLAKAQGVAIGVTRPYPLVIERIKAWSRDLKSKGIVLMPVTGIIASRNESG